MMLHYCKIFKHQTDEYEFSSMNKISRKNIFNIIYVKYTHIFKCMYACLLMYNSAHSCSKKNSLSSDEKVKLLVIMF